MSKVQVGGTVAYAKQAEAGELMQGTRGLHLPSALFQKIFQKPRLNGFFMWSGRALCSCGKKCYTTFS